MKRRSAWERLNDERLLELRICELPLAIPGSFIEPHLVQLYDELRARRIRCRPHAWLSGEWFSPDDIPGIAIPFYLAHPRLMRLEHNQMLEVEGGSDAECMRILRHEAGHALDSAYRLHHRRRWRELFGSFASPYPDSYIPVPESRDYVLHLRAWYAQAHPAEDCAETFAVWLSPRSRWQARYTGWPALAKLEYADDIFRTLAGTAPVNHSRARVETLSTLTMTLREHYEHKRSHYEFVMPAVFDRDLRRMFSDDPRHAALPRAAAYLRNIRREVRHIVADGTGVHQYTIDQVLGNMIDRCTAMNLRVVTPLHESYRRVLITVTVHVMNVLHLGYHRISV